MADEVERLKAELAAVKNRAVTTIKQQAQKVAEQDQALSELRAQLKELRARTDRSASDTVRGLPPYGSLCAGFDGGFSTPMRPSHCEAAEPWMCRSRCMKMRST